MPGPNWPGVACFPTGPVARRGPHSFYLRPGELNSPGLRASGASRLRRVPPRQAAGKAGEHPGLTAPPGNTPDPGWPGAACLPTGPSARRGPQSFYLRPGEVNPPGLRASGASRLRRVPPRQAAGKAGEHPGLTAPPGNTPDPGWPGAACLPTGPSARRGPQSFYLRPGEVNPPGLRASGASRLRRVPPRQAAGRAGEHLGLTAPPGNTPGPNWPGAACRGCCAWR